MKLRSLYKAEYMRDFTKIFCDFLKMDDPMEAKLLYKSFLRQSKVIDSDNYSFSHFQKICRKLLRMKYDSVVLEFAYGMHQCRYEYDLDLLEIALSEIKVTDQLKLDDWCSGFISEMESRKFEELEAIIEAEYILRTRYSCEIRVREFTGKDAGRLAKLAESRQEVPTLFLPVFRALVSCGKLDEAFELLEKYVLPSLNEVVWESDELAETRIMAAVFERYYFSLQKILTQEEGTDPDCDYAVEYTGNDLLSDSIGKNGGRLINQGKKKFKKYPQFAVNLEKLLVRGNRLFKELIWEDQGSFLKGYAAYALYCSGKATKASNFLIRYYDDLRITDKRRRYTQITLIRSIVEAKRLETATTLYGYYVYERDRPNREKGPILQYISDVKQFLLDAEKEIKAGGDYVIETKESWYDLLYTNNAFKILDFLKDVEGKTKAGTIIERSEFDQLKRLLCAFSYPDGVRLDLLGLPNQDQESYLENALSAELLTKGIGYRKDIDSAEAYYHNRITSDAQKSIDLAIQYHMSELMEQEIEQSLLKVQEIKRKQKESGKRIDSEEESKMIEQMDQICADLSKKLQENDALGRVQMEQVVYNAQRTFIERYCPEYEGNNLLNNLPADCREEVFNFLVTAETVFRFMKDRDDVRKLDFSPALISMTKALELVMNHVFKRMDVRELPGMSIDIKKLYFTKKGKGLRKYELELGPCVYLIQDGPVKIRENRFGTRLVYDDSVSKTELFEGWKGERVLDVSKLKEIRDIDVTIKAQMEGERTYVTRNLQFTDDNEYNRMILAQGIDYVRDQYRNKVAHKEMIEKKKVESCRDILIMTENLLWILIYIIRP